MSFRTFCSLLALATASAGRRHIHSRDVCSSSPFWHALSEHGSPFQSPLSPAPYAQTQPSPWAFQGECVSVEDTLCVFTSDTFANGRGVSILTTDERAESIANLPVFAEAGALSGVNDHSSPPYEEKELPGRGRGLVANKTLHRGDRIFATTPLLVIDEDAYENLEEEKWLHQREAAVNQLPPGSRELFWELYGQPVADAVSDRINTNAFEIEIDDDTYYIVVPEIARLNHDCRPNAVYFFDWHTLTHYVHAITTIDAGTEITISYIDATMPRRQRLAELSSWGFNCSCSACSQHSVLSQASDARLATISALSSRLDQTPPASPQIPQALVSLYNQERLHTFLSSAYRHAALSYCAEGQRWSTIQYAQLAVEFSLLDDGFRDSSVPLMMRLAQQPESQPCWLQRAN